MTKNDTRIICMIRHGKTTQNIHKKIQGRKNFQLSDTGREEALKTAFYLKKNDEDWDISYSSPLDRAKDTAKIIASTINYQGEIIIDDAFQERDFGVSEGMDVCPEVFVKVLDDSWEGLEKTKDIMARVVGGINKIISTSNYKKILIISHAHAINSVLLSIDNTRRMNSPMFNCSMNYIKYENGKLSIIEANKMPN